MDVRPPKPQSLLGRLLLIALLAVLPALTIIALETYEDRRDALAEAQREQHNHLRLIAAEKEARRQRARLFLDSLTHLPEVRAFAADPEACSRALASLRKAWREYANFGVVNPSGNPVCSAVAPAEPVSFADRDWFRQVLQGKPYITSGYAVGRITGKPVNVHAMPLAATNGVPAGVVFASLDLEWMGDFGRLLKLSEGTMVGVLDPSGRVLFRQAEPEKWMGRDLSGFEIVRTIIAAQGEGSRRALGPDGIERLYAYMPLTTGEGRQVFLFVTTPLQPIEHAILVTLLRNLALGVAALALALLVAWFLGERIVGRPVSALAAAKERTDTHNALLRALSDSEKTFIAEAEPQLAFQRLVDHFVQLTGSRYGMIGEVDAAADGRRRLRVLALSSGLDWQALSGGREVAFDNPDTLLGAVFARGETVVANFPAADPRRGGALPPGHPPLAAFMGLPLYRGGRRIGMIGLANREGGYDEAAVAYLRPLLDSAAILIEAYRNETRRREAEAALRELNERLEERVQQRTADLQASLAELESFSYSVSHDLRGPLRGINGFARILAEDYGERLDEAGREHLARIAAAAERMGELIDDLIELSQLSRAPMRNENVDLSALAGNIAEELRASDRSREAEFVVEPGLRARGDPLLLRAALANLLGNAWKYTARQADARIEFGSALREGRAAFFVRDNGAGFEMAYADKLFQPFQRLHPPGEYSGSGIGLATVRRIVARHGGEVWAEGAPGGGATFWFALPAT